MTQSPSLSNLVAQSPNESIGNRGVERAGPESILPLLISQLREQVTRPDDVVRRNSLEQLLMPAVIVELDRTVRDVRNKGLTLKDVDIAATPCKAAGFPKRRPEIAYHVPMLWTVAGLLHFIECVVLVFQI